MESIHEEQEQRLSSITIGMIVLSVLTVIGLCILISLLLKRKKQDYLKEQQIPKTNESRLKEILNCFHKQKSNHDYPITSSLDNHELFYTILKYPPTKPAAAATLLSHKNGSVHTLDCNQSNITHSSTVDFKIEQSRMDPISASLVRQSIEERSGYYKDPSRIAIPYYKRNQLSPSSAINKSQTNDYLMTPIHEDEGQRWSNSSYQVW